jgi:predicted transposase YbfD/YdcC
MVGKETVQPFGSCWEGLEDLRCGNAALHDLVELLMIALCCVLCGSQGAVDIAVCAEAKELFLRSFLTVANGLPSHPTFSRLFRNLDTDQFRDSFQRFMTQFSEQLLGVMAIDGKVLRRSFDRTSGKSALHIVSAWKQHQWPALNAIGKVVQMRETTDKTTIEGAYYQLSRVLSPQRLAPERLNQVVRRHWEIENSLHWRLDVVMNEDQDRTRMGHGPYNLVVLRRMAINAMQKEGSKGPLRGKFKRAG